MLSVARRSLTARLLGLGAILLGLGVLGGRAAPWDAACAAQSRQLLELLLMAVLALLALRALPPTASAGAAVAACGPRRRDQRQRSPHAVEEERGNDHGHATVTVLHHPGSRSDHRGAGRWTRCRPGHASRHHGEPHHGGTTTRREHAEERECVERAGERE